MAFSKKQLEILLFPKTKYTALVCDGAIRSGKTSVMSLSFLLWAMSNFDQQNFAICGKSVQSAVRNVIQPLMGVTYFPKNGFRLNYSISTHCLTVTRGSRTNRFFVFGGKDESSYMLIQGVTLAGVLLDEVALMPRSFVEQALARCSVQGSRFWFNCNPENPRHWFNEEWVIDREHKKNRLHLHFLLDDNPSLPQEVKERYENMYPGVFRDRYILGKWTVAEGLIYPEVAAGLGIVPSVPRNYVKYAISIDYGTLNPCSMGLWGLCDGVWYRFKEFYHNGRELRRQLTDEEYYQELEKLAGDRKIEMVVVDPSAASFIACIRKHGRFFVRHARNDVLDGIRKTAGAFQEGKVAVCDCCSGAVSEFASYRWDDKKNEDKPIKENDHAMDEIRYFVNTVLSGHGIARAARRL